MNNNSQQQPPQHPQPHPPPPTWATALDRWIKQVALAVSVGTLLGGFEDGRKGHSIGIAYLDSLRPPPTKKEARRTLNRIIRKHIAHGMWRWGLRMTGFVAVYSSIELGLEVLQNKQALWHGMLAGGCTGLVFGVVLLKPPTFRTVTASVLVGTGYALILRSSVILMEAVRTSLKEGHDPQT